MLFCYRKRKQSSKLLPGLKDFPRSDSIHTFHATLSSATPPLNCPPEHLSKLGLPLPCLVSSSSQQIQCLHSLSRFSSMSAASSGRRSFLALLAVVIFSQGLQQHWGQPSTPRLGSVNVLVYSYVCSCSWALSIDTTSLRLGVTVRCLCSK